MYTYYMDYKKKKNNNFLSTPLPYHIHTLNLKRRSYTHLRVCKYVQVKLPELSMTTSSAFIDAGVPTSSFETATKTCPPEHYCVEARPIQ